MKIKVLEVEDKKEFETTVEQMTSEGWEPIFETFKIYIFGNRLTGSKVCYTMLLKKLR